MQVEVPCKNRSPNIERMRKNTIGARLTAAILLVLGTLASGGLFSSCAYTETMREREVEGQILQGELNYEIERGNRLSR